MPHKTLQEILEKERINRCEGGTFGIKACKESIKWDMDHKNKDLYTLLDEYTKRAQTDVCFNDAMVLSCWELINEEK